MSFAKAAISIGGSLIGGLASKKSSGGTQTQTTSNEPWAAVQPWLKDNITAGQDLQKYYQQNPFNQQQVQAYNNIFGDLDQFRNQMAPGLFNFANGMMTNQYQRPTYERPGMAGYGSSREPVAQMQNPVFSMPQSTGNYGLLDMNQTAPQPAAPVAAAPAAVPDLMASQAEQDKLKLMLAGYYDQYSPYYGGPGAGTGGG